MALKYVKGPELFSQGSKMKISPSLVEEASCATAICLSQNFVKEGVGETTFSSIAVRSPPPGPFLFF